MEPRFFYVLVCAIVCVGAMSKESDDECDKEVEGIFARRETTEAPAVFVTSVGCNAVAKDAGDDVNLAGPSTVDTSSVTVKKTSGDPKSCDGSASRWDDFPRVECRSNIMTITRSQQLTGAEWALVKARVKALLYRGELRPLLCSKKSLPGRRKETDWTAVLKEEGHLFIKIQDDNQILQYARPDGMTFQIWREISLCARRSILRSLQRWRLR